MKAAPAPVARGILLSMLVFVCGWSLMMLEMLGPRILAPSFGTGIYAWGSVIGVFLLALSLGYYAGGRLSTRFPSPTGLAALVVVCSAWLTLLPHFYGPVSDWLFDWLVVARGAHEKWGSLSGATVLFLGPSVLFGMVSPYAIRLAATDVSSVGEKAGYLYAISTIGSFLGCMMTSFYLILWLGLRHILYLHAALLFVAACAFLGAWRVLSRPQSKETDQ